jgi:hypothetical protein
MSGLSESDFAEFEQRVERKEKRRIEDRWRIDKTISPSIIVTIVTFIVTGTLAYADLKRSDDLIKADNASLHVLFQHMEKSEQESLDKVSSQYEALSAKVDRLIERQIPRPGSK